MDAAKRNLISQWAFDTRPVLGRFHLWLDDVEVERMQEEPVSAHSFTPRGISRCMAMTAATTALGARLFGQFGEGQGKDKATFNQVKKAADAITAYVMSEGLWYLTRALPENHAIMVSLGEGIMPKAGETPEMGANPLLGFGRVYARPEVARRVDALVHQMLNDRTFGWQAFHAALREKGLTVWGAAVDTLENTSRFAEGKATGPMSVLHLFDSPLRVTKPWEAYMGCLTVPRKVVDAAAKASTLLDFCTPRAKVVEAITLAYPGIQKQNIHVWTLSGKSRATRLSGLWEQWKTLGCHLVEDGWKAPSGLPVFTDSGTYAPTCMVRGWKDAAGVQHVFLCDGYAASAEAVQAASFSEVYDVDVTMTPLSSVFDLPLEREQQTMKLSPDAPDFKERFAEIVGASQVDDGKAQSYAAAIRDARESNVPLDKRVLRCDDFMPEKGWRVLSCIGYMCDDPYTGTPGVEKLSDNRYRVTTRLATRNASAKIAFTFELREPIDQIRLAFSPLLVRFLSGLDYRERAVKVSDSGRIRNELQTMLTQALEYEGDQVTVHFDKVEEAVLPRAGQEIIRQALQWYKQQHPVWFSWLKIA